MRYVDPDRAIRGDRDSFGVPRSTFVDIVESMKKNTPLAIGIALGGLLTLPAVVAHQASASTVPPDSTAAPESTVPSVGPSEPPFGYPPGFDVMVGRVKASGAPDAVKDRILSRIEDIKDRSVAAPPTLGALGEFIGRTIEQSPLRQQIRDQIRLQTKDFDRLMDGNDIAGAKDEIRRIVSRYRQEMFLLVQERVHTHLDDLIARLPELKDKIDDEAWRAELVGLRDRVRAAEDLAMLRSVVVEIRDSLTELRSDIKGS